jgi:hypothetical protein
VAPAQPPHQDQGGHRGSREVYGVALKLLNGLQELDSEAAMSATATANRIARIPGHGLMRAQRRVPGNLKKNSTSEQHAPPWQLRADSEARGRRGRLGRRDVR